MWLNGGGGVGKKKKKKETHANCINIFINVPTRDEGPFFFLVCSMLRKPQNLFRIDYISLTSSPVFHLQNLPPIHHYPLRTRIWTIIRNATLNKYFATEKASVGSS